MNINADVSYDDLRKDKDGFLGPLENLGAWDDTFWRLTERGYVRSLSDEQLEKALVSLQYRLRIVDSLRARGFAPSKAELRHRSLHPVIRPLNSLVIGWEKLGTVQLRSETLLALLEQRLESMRDRIMQVQQARIEKQSAEVTSTT